MTQHQSYDDFTLSVLRDAWDTFRQDALVFVVGAVILSTLAFCTLGLLTGPLTIGYLEIVRRSRRGEPLSVNILFSRFDSFVASTVAGVLIFIAAFLGTILLVLPGLLVIVFSTYTLPAIAHEELGGVEAIRRSITLVRENFLHTLAVLVVICCVHALGGIALFVGLLVSGPFALILLEVAYERLEGHAPATPPGLVMEP